jgi:hypothetical protein
MDLLEIARRVSAADLLSCRVVTGFDGFVDELVAVVGERRTRDDFAPVPDIGTFAAMIAAAAGQSSLRSSSRRSSRAAARSTWRTAWRVSA